MRDLTTDPETPGQQPAEGRPDLGLPGADRPDTEDPGNDAPQRLGERIENGPGEGIATGEPDLVPDVEIPESSM